MLALVVATALFPDASEGEAPVPILVELFTSQGCESCPPADELLTELAREPLVPGTLVIPLGQHVDYWSDEWADPFAAPQFTERQRSYHALVGDRALYTPEMIIDGRAQFVGSQRGLAEHAIMQARAVRKAPITLTATRPADDVLAVALTITEIRALASTEALQILVAVSEVGLETTVDSGENAGRTLRHAAVARWLQELATLPLPHHDTYATTVDVPIDDAWPTTDLRVVAFVQERESRHVRGVAQVAVD